MKKRYDKHQNPCVYAAFAVCLYYTTRAALTHYPSSVRILCKKRLIGIIALYIGGKKFVHSLRYILKNRSSVLLGLLVGSGICNCKIIAPASVPFRLDTVKGKADYCQHIRPYGSRFPGGIYLRRCRIFYIVLKRHIIILTTVRRWPLVYYHKFG